MMQRLRKTFRRISVLGAAALMTGATLGSAIAADLSDFPSPFVMDGKYNADTAIVVGERALAEDTLGAIDIGNALQFESKVCVPTPGAGGSISVSGDAIEVGDRSDLLEINESIGEVRQTVTEVELDGLRGGIVTTNEGTTAFNQYMRFQDLQATFSGNTLVPPRVIFGKNDAPSEDVGDWLQVVEGSNVTGTFFEYELEFEDGLETDIASNKLEDYKDEEIVIMGNHYTFVDTSIDTSKDDVSLKLLGGAVFDVLEEGEVKTYTIDGKEFEVEVLIIEDTTPPTVTLVVNGEITDQLVEGETEILKDGTLIGVSDIVLNEAGEAGSGDIVELYVGANKLEFHDSNYSDTETNDVNNRLGFHQDVKMNEEQIEDAYVQIKGVELDSAKAFEISRIKYRLQADALPGYRDLFVPPGHGVREFLDEPQGMLGSGWDIKYEGLDDTGVSVIKVTPSGDDEYSMEVENLQGSVYKFPYVTAQNGNMKFGDDNDDFVFIEGFVETNASANSWRNLSFNVGLRDYFILSDASKNKQGTNDGDGDTGPAFFGNNLFNTDGHPGVGAMDDTAYSHIVRYNSIDTSDNKLQFDDLATGSREFVYENSTIPSVLGRAELVFGGNSYVAYIANVTQSGGDNPLAIDMDADGDVDLTEIRFTVNGGGILDFGNATESYGGNYSTKNAANGVGAQSWNNVPPTSIDIDGDRNPGEFQFNITTLSEDFDENRPSDSGGTTSANDDVTFLVVERASNRIGVDRNSTLGLGLENPDDDDDNYYGMTPYGIWVNLFEPSGTNDPETLTIEYPLTQRGARVFVTMGDSTTTKTASGETCTVAKIDMTNLLDSEVGDPADYDLILVGGPCANNVVGQVSGFPSCDAWPYKPGEAVIQLADNGDKVAMLVAGTNAPDTRMAARVVANYQDYALSGDKVMVSGSISSPTVGAA